MIVSLYRSPSGTMITFFNKLHEFLASVHGVPFDIILAGDFDINFLEVGSATVSDICWT